MDRESNSADYELVARAIVYLDAHQTEQPSLDTVASVMGVSPFHLQRVFTRWAGVSPKRFLQYLTLAHAKELLAESRPVLEAAYGAGLSGPGRLHDLFVTVEGVTPGEYKAQGDGLSIAYGRHATPFGDCLLALTELGVCGLSFIDDANGLSWEAAVAALMSNWPGAALAERPSATSCVADIIFSADRRKADRPLALYMKGTNFQLKVWEALLRIPTGAVSDYGEVARSIDSPSANRAVGAAVGGNHIAYLIPCHRVIRSSGAISGYRWGATRKRAMLGWEAAQLERQSALG